MDRRQVNEDRLRVFGERAETIAFVCECVDGDCHRTVLLAPDDYRALREADSVILYPSHTSGGQRWLQRTIS